MSTTTIPFTPLFVRRQLPSLLKKHGYSLTAKRQKILAVMTLAPLTAQEIFAKLKTESPLIDLASIYRNLQIFEKIGLVQSVQLTKDRKHFELITPNHHHHHIVCQTCGVIKDLKLPAETSLLQTVAKKTGFQITGHSLEFFGTCGQCQ